MKLSNICLILAFLVLTTFWLSGCDNVEIERPETTAPAVPFDCGVKQVTYPKPKKGMYKVLVYITDDPQLIVDSCKHGPHVKACAWPNSGLIMMLDTTWQCWVIHEVGHVLKVNQHD